MMSKANLGKAVAVALVAGLAVIAALQVKGPAKGPDAEIPVERPAAAAPSSGRVTMIDLGATECVPCKMMAPILEELKKEYAGEADIIFIDVWKNPPEARKYGIRAIPTQIFYNAEGREVYRHTGFLDKKRIVDILTRLGVSSGQSQQRS